jgi:hypothetical protein
MDVLRAEDQKRGGECLAKAYDTVEQKLEWRCARGHVFLLAPDSLTAGRWCPHCAQEDRNALRLQKMRDIAKERGGRCLSDVYTGSRDKLLWPCHQGHV